MNVSELLGDALGRVREQMPDLVAGLSDDDLAWRPDPEANSIAWLVWHLTRIEDDHVAGVAGTEQVWVAEGWAQRFGLPFGVHEHGYSMSTADVGKVRVSADLLTGYYEAVAARTAAYVATLGPDDLDRPLRDPGRPADQRRQRGERPPRAGSVRPRTARAEVVPPDQRVPTR